MIDDLSRTLIDIARAGMAPHDYPRPLERLGPIIPGRLPRNHIHIWSIDREEGTKVCHECGYEAGEHE